MERAAAVVRRHPLHVGLVSVTAGAILSGAGAGGAGALAAGLSLLSVGLWAGRQLLGLAAAAVLLAGFVIGSARLESIDRSQVEPLIDHALTARGHVVKRERPTQYGRRARVRLTGVKLGPAMRRWGELRDVVQVEAGLGMPFPSRLTVGEELVIKGVLARPVRRPDADFDYAAYLRRSGVHALLRAESVRRTGRRRGGLAGFIDHLRRRAEQGVAATLSPSLAALARGVVLGQDEAISPETADQFKASGLAHLLAVSGQNVTLLALLALSALAALGFGRHARLAAVLALIALYVPLTGAGPSILRAGAMGGAGVIAALAGRPASRWYGVLLAAAFTLLLDPRAWIDVGWQLSFAAVVGIFCLVPSLTKALSRLPQPIAAGAAVTVAATVATAPLMAFHFEQVSAVSLAANLAVLPVVAPIMWMGMLAAAIAQLSVAPAALMNGLNGYCLAYLAATARWSAALPSAVLPLRLGSPLALAGCYGALGALAVACERMRCASRVPQLRRRAIAAAVALSALVAAWGLRAQPHEPPGRFTVSFLDVGQGDATLIQAPGGVAVLVDGGPPEADLTAKLVAAGVRSLDVVVLTHPQEDHQGGLEAVLRRIPARVLLDGGAGSRDRTHRRIVELARSKGAGVLPAGAGQRLRAGPLRLRVLSPEQPGIEVDADDDPNARAVVVLASYGDFDVLLPADAESDVTLGLPLEPAEILKVAHHGSSDDGLPALLERVRPALAVIEVGARNRYGHPDAKTLERLRSAVPRVLRTDEDGDVRVSLSRDGPVVATEH